ncbi:MAG: UDP-N-acetylmuramoyl-L-alanyl-D-glutamate--2,6-diaminopimelate ligase [Candidatus Doudnabacteria bacterium]
MSLVLGTIKKILPEAALKKIRPIGHGFLAYLGAMAYGFPAKKMIVVGITGTAGKSTTTRFLASILNEAGKKTGYITTVNFFDGNNDFMNRHGMSMPGRFLLQEELSAMLKNKCEIAIVECTSEGLFQNRHKGIDFDIAAITNLSEAHLDSHGGFENYKKAKGKLFEALEKSTYKNFFQKKVILVSAEDRSKNFFLGFKADKKIEVKFDQSIKINLQGEFNEKNAIFAAAIADELGVTDKAIQQKGLLKVHQIPGRMQQINNSKGIKIFLDYAPEPVAMENALQAAKAVTENKIIHVFGSTGGHRDVSKRFEFGKISGKISDTIVITNDDVYDSNPQQIAKDIQQGISRALPKKVSEVLVVLDRKEAIKTAIDLAQPGDTVIITGKGSEQFLVLPGNKRIVWDENKIIEAAL